MKRFFLIALLIFLNCGNDKTLLVEVETNPYEQLLGYWTADYTVEYFSNIIPDRMGEIYYEELFVFQQNHTVLYRVKAKTVISNEGTSESVSIWMVGIYTYDKATEFLVFFRLHWFSNPLWTDTFYPYKTDVIIYDGGNSFILEDVIHTKQDTLPDWAE